jgi:hypothetical protein
VRAPAQRRGHQRQQRTGDEPAHRGDPERGEEAAPAAGERGTEVGPTEEERTVGEVEHVHHPEDDRQPDRQDEQQEPDGEPVEDADEHQAAVMPRRAGSAGRGRRPRR